VSSPSASTWSRWASSSSPTGYWAGVISAFRLFSYGALPVGALVGGVLARSFGLPAPFLVAGVVIPVVTMLILPFVNRRTVEDALAVAEESTVDPATGLSTARRTLT